MERAGYLHAVTQNDGTNEVGILWKKDKYTLSAVDDSVITTKENNNPNVQLPIIAERVDICSALAGNEGEVLYKKYLKEKNGR